MSRLHDMALVYSKEFNEEIEYYTDDLNYSNSVMGCGLETGNGYTITFDEDGNVENVEPIG